MLADRVPWAMNARFVSRSIALLVALLVVLASVPGVAVAEPRSGGSVIVAAGETVGDLETLAGSVVVYGTVNGDLSAVAGDVTVAPSGRITGDVSAAAGSVRIAGTVEGNVSGGAGDVTVADGATVGGDLQAGAATVRINGAVAGDVTAGADTIVLGPRASIGGDLTYDGTLQGNRGAVAGTIERDTSMGVGPDVGGVTNWVLGLYAFLVNLALGALLLLVAPAFSRRVADRALESPLASGGVGLLTLVIVPILLVVTALTIIGIPLTIVGAVLFAVLAWVAVVYGRFVVGSWLLTYADTDNQWAALVVGFLVVAVAVRIPWLGGVVDLLVFVLGLGALVLVANDRRRARRESPEAAVEGDVQPA